MTRGMDLNNHHQKEFYGPWAIVTGASEGIGRAFSWQLAQRKFNLILVSRRQRELDSLASEIGTACNVSIKILAADLTQHPQLKAVLEDTQMLDVGLLVACAGFGTSGPFVENNPEVELNMIDLNCRALAEMTYVFANRFKSRGRGGIILMSSLLAFQGVPRSANYAATKAYVQSLAEGLRVELKPFGVDVLSSAPGPVRSGFEKRAGMKMAGAASPDVVARATLQALGRQTTIRPGFLSKVLELALKPLPRWGRVSVMARIMAGMTPNL